MGHIWTLHETEMRKIFSLRHAVDVAISIGYVDGAYIYSRMAVRHALRSRWFDVG